jgi:hypothetical protein
MYNINFEDIQYILFLVIVILQIRFFIKTRNAISRFKTAIPPVNDIHISAIGLTTDELESIFERDVLNDPESVKPWQSSWESAGEPEDGGEPLIKIKVVKTTNNPGEVFTSITEALNKYLFYNRHSVADFHLIKDIVERNTSTLEDEINLTISTPLYLGLMGTMLGIVIGLFSMSHLMTMNVSDKGLSTGIATLLGSVKIAMIGSFVGLAFTIINSAVAFRGTKYKLEAKKNAFYTLIQIELLPALNQGMESTLESLQINLSKFNEGFGQNLGKLSGVFDKNYEAIKLNKDLIDQLNSSKVAEITEYNVKVLGELKTSVAQFEKFNKLFKNVDDYLEATYRLADKSTEVLQRTDNLRTIAEKIQETISRNQELFEFLQNHFKELTDFKEKVTQAVAESGFKVRDAFNDVNKMMIDAGEMLRTESALRNIESQKVFAEFTLELKKSFEVQTESFQKAAEEQRESFRLAVEEKKSNLDQLSNLGPLLSEVKSLKTTGGGSNTDKLLYQLHELNRMLRHIESDIRRPFFKKMFTKGRYEEEQ